MYTSALYHLYPKAQPASLQLQIKKGVLACPQTKEVLDFAPDKDALQTRSGLRYPVRRGVPILVPDPDQASTYVSASEKMVSEYRDFESNSSMHRLKLRLSQLLNATYQSQRSIAAHRKTFDIPDEGICLSIGGGPTRSHPRSVNLNIGAFENVEIVADAHVLPYVDSCIDSVVCEDVLEHIREPDKVVREMYRVMKPGAYVYSATPFLISYHGYPYHFQNFTHQGHAELYRRCGFEVVEAGVCMGAFTAFLSLVGFMFATFLPKAFGIRTLVCRSWRVFSALVKPLDRLFQTSPQAAESAFSTFVLARKI
ncbi:methyltransferase domain-containing protein [Oligoflexus tunisiensis]|uniref:methyltransferase domain-containing protein n=1 Tax=Oligoflexus tunisiensis TaxID=708132 RepID=UPI00114CD2AA|nr:methyltransferase domain-containing protein [Oligoflexus tunisiensis]